MHSRSHARTHAHLAETASTCINHSPASPVFSCCCCCSPMTDVTVEKSCCSSCSFFSFFFFFVCCGYFPCRFQSEELPHSRGRYWIFVVRFVFLFEVQRNKATENFGLIPQHNCVFEFRGRSRYESLKVRLSWLEPLKTLFHHPHALHPTKEPQLKVRSFTLCVCVTNNSMFQSSFFEDWILFFCFWAAIKIFSFFFFGKCYVYMQILQPRVFEFFVSCVIIFTISKIVDLDFGRCRNNPLNLLNHYGKKRQK